MAAVADSITDSPADAVLDQVRAAVEAMGTSDVSRCGHDQLDRLTNAAQRVRGFLVSFDTRVARRRQELWEGAGEPAPEAGDDSPGDAQPDDPATGPGGEPGSSAGDPTLGFDDTGGHRSDGERERDHARARTLVLFPTFEHALTVGAIDGAHVDALTAALGRFDVTDQAERDARSEFIDHHEMLLGYARNENPKRFRDRCQQLSLRLARAHGLALTERQRRDAEVRTWINPTTGMGHLQATFEPELYESVVTALDNHLADVRATSPNTGERLQRMRVEALAALICHSGALATHHPEIIVLVDLDTLRTGILTPDSTSETIHGTPLHPETVRRLACDGHLIPAVLGSEGQPLDVGRRHRKATWAQRRALATMYRTCAHPDCQVPFRRCRIHHIIWWTHDGLTDLANLLPLCDRHHHHVHEGGWQLTMSADRVLTLLAPDSTHYFTGDTTDRSSRTQRLARSAAAGTSLPNNARGASEPRPQDTNTRPGTRPGAGPGTGTGADPRSRPGSRSSTGADPGSRSRTGSGSPTNSRSSPSTTSGSPTNPRSSPSTTSGSPTNPRSSPSAGHGTSTTGSGMSSSFGNGNRPRSDAAAQRRPRRRPSRPDPRAARARPAAQQNPAAAHRPIGHRPSLFDHADGRSDGSDDDHDDHDPGHG